MQKHWGIFLGILKKVGIFFLSRQILKLGFFCVQNMNICPEWTDEASGDQQAVQTKSISWEKKDLTASDDQHVSADKIPQSESIPCDKKKDLTASDDQHASADKVP